MLDVLSVFPSYIKTNDHGINLKLFITDAESLVLMTESSYVGRK
jgi:hypothetical protein